MGNFLDSIIEEVQSLEQNKLKELKEKLLEKEKKLFEKEKKLLEKEKNLEEKEKKFKERYTIFEGLSENYFNNFILKNLDDINLGKCCDKIRNDIKNYVKTLSNGEKNYIEGFQQYLTEYNPNFKFANNKIKVSFSYKFGEPINNKTFIYFIKNGLSTLYSSDKEIYHDVFNFFKNIEAEIKNFIYIPMINNNSLCELKKHIYLGALTSQLKENGFKTIINYIFYTDEYFNESEFKEISFNIKRRESFIKKFKNYEKDHIFVLNINNLKDYIFSKTMKEAYLETCKDIFGYADFVNEKNIEIALNEIYENIIKKNMKLAKLERGYYGVTIYSKKIFISNELTKNILESSLYEEKVAYLGGLVKIILQEIIHCLTNLLPLLSTKYKELSNPFLGTFKKNMNTYDYVIGNKINEKEKDSLIEFLNNKIVNYKLIGDSGELLEIKLFGNNKKNKMDYITSEYFLYIKNLNQSLKNFRDNLKLFEDKITDSDELNKLRKDTSKSFKNFNKIIYFGKCFLNPKKINIYE